MRLFYLYLLIFYCSILSVFSQDLEISRYQFNPFPHLSAGMVSQQVLQGPAGTTFVIWKNGPDHFVSQYVMDRGQNLYFERIGAFDPDAYFFSQGDELFMITHEHIAKDSVIQFSLKLFDDKGKGSEKHELASVPFPKSKKIASAKIRYFLKKKDAGLLITVQDQNEQTHTTGRMISVIDIDAGMNALLSTREIAIENSFYMDEVKADDEGNINGIIYLNLATLQPGELLDEVSAWFISIRKQDIQLTPLRSGYMKIISAAYDCRDGKTVVAGYARDGEDMKTLSAFINTISPEAEVVNEQLDKLADEHISAVLKYMEAGVKNKKKQDAIFSIADVSIYENGSVSIISLLKVKVGVPPEAEYFQQADIFLSYYDSRGMLQSFQALERAANTNVIYRKFLSNPAGGGWVFYDGGYTNTSLQKGISSDVIAFIGEMGIKKVSIVGEWDYKRYTWDYEMLLPYSPGCIDFSKGGWLMMKPAAGSVFAR